VIRLSEHCQVRLINRYGDQKTKNRLVEMLLEEVEMAKDERRLKEMHVRLSGEHRLTAVLNYSVTDEA
jgi:ABC-type dipeptide/oligopeptide/nickel transport system ATPase component